MTIEVLSAQSATIGALPGRRDYQSSSSSVSNYGIPATPTATNEGSPARAATTGAHLAQSESARALPAPTAGTEALPVQ